MQAAFLAPCNGHHRFSICLIPMTMLALEASFGLDVRPAVSAKFSLRNSTLYKSLVDSLAARVQLAITH